MPGVLFQAGFLQRLQPFVVVSAQQFGAFFHHFVRRPGFRIDDIGVFKGFLHAVDLAEAAAGGLCVVFRHFDNVRDQVIAFRVGEGDLHTEAGHQADNALRYRKRFPVTRRIGPGHGDLLAFQVLQRAEVLAQPGEVRHGLRWVVDIAL